MGNPKSEKKGLYIEASPEVFCITGQAEQSSKKLWVEFSKRVSNSYM